MLNVSQMPKKANKPKTKGESLLLLLLSLLLFFNFNQVSSFKQCPFSQHNGVLGFLYLFNVVPKQSHLIIIIIIIIIMCLESVLIDSCLGHIKFVKVGARVCVEGEPRL